ncbi:MAG: histidine phosphatase family protein [Anaerolineales bacterium]
MHIYLVRHAATDTRNATDPYNHPLSAAGQGRARELAALCQEWGIELLVVGMMQHSLETADAISALLPHVERWDLADLEEMALDDLLGDPTASHLVSTWTPEQFQTGLERLWIRVMPVVTRILIYAEAHRLQNVAIVAGEQVLKLMLLNWLDQDWTGFTQQELALAPGSVTCVTIDDDGARIDYLNQV